MAIIDYHSIKSGIFAKLTKSSKILIPVLSCLCDDWDGSLSPEHSKHHILALYAGLSISSIQRALKELQEKGIIAIETQSGRPASIQYLPQLKLSAKNQKDSSPTAPANIGSYHWWNELHNDQKPRSQLPTSQLNLGHSDRPLLEKIPPQTPPDKEPVSVGTLPAPNDSPKSLNNKQTALVPRSLIKTWWPLKGPKFVMSVLREMEKKNGEIKDPAAYFVTCCKNNWVPSSKKAERELAAEAAREERTLYEEAERQRWEREKQSVITEQADPDAQERIKAIQKDFWENMGDYRPPAEITNYAQEHDYPG